jgi:Glycosyl transferase family 2
MPRAACVMMQKDEEQLLEPWLAYHGHLFGLENLSVFDHGSVSPKVRKILDRYERMGVHVDRSHKDAIAYSRKAEIMGARMRELDGMRKYDFLFPLDCDEFVARRTESGFTCDREAIHESLATLQDEQRTLKIAFQFANVPGRPDSFCYFEFRKTFFAADTFGWTDQGHHFEGSWKAPGFRETEITHLHFHNKPYPLLIEHARRKLRVHIDPDDIEGLRNYKGRSVHLVPYLLMSETEYYARYDDQVQFYYPEFGRLMRALGAPVAFGDDADRTERKRVDSRVITGPPEGANGFRGSLMMLPVRFDGAQYLKANADVASAGADPLVHFCRYGFKEGRRVRPR